MNIWFAQFGWELKKLFARKRTYIGFGVFLAFEIGVLICLRLPRVQNSLKRSVEQTGYDAAEYLSGLTLALLILHSTIVLLGGLYLALVAGDIASKEVEDGTMRMILSRPVARRRILGLKAAACGLYTLTLVFFISVTALLAGFCYAGFGGLFAFDPGELFALYDFGEGLSRYLLSIPLLACSMFSVTALGFLFSCCNMKPAAATIMTLSILLVDTIMRNIPYFESLRGWFFTARMGTWFQVFQYRIPWEKMLEDYMWLGAIDATLLIIGWIAFERRDFKS